MKFRAGFVSNSSTSSFVISWRPEDIVKCEHCQRGSIDPITLLNGSEFLQKNRTTEIICIDPAAKIEEWQVRILNSRIDIAKLEKVPAGEVVIPEDWQMTPEEKEEYLTDPHSTRVWQQIGGLSRNIHILEQKIRKLQKIIGEGRNVIWAIVYNDDPIDKMFGKMEADKLIRFEREVW
jgi:hypothetical protein